MLCFALAKQFTCAREKLRECVQDKTLPYQAIWRQFYRLFSTKNYNSTIANCYQDQVKFCVTSVDTRKVVKAEMLSTWETVGHM